MKREYRDFLRNLINEASSIRAASQSTRDALAVVLTSAGLHRAAERAAQEAIVHEPGVSSFLNAAIILARRGKYLAAVDLLAESIKQHPDGKLHKALIEYARMSQDSRALERAAKIAKKAEVTEDQNAQSEFGPRVESELLQLQARTYWQPDRQRSEIRKVLAAINGHIDRNWRALFETLHLRGGRMGPASISACEAIAPYLVNELIRCAREFGPVGRRQLILASVVYGRRVTLVCRVKGDKLVKATWTSDAFVLKQISSEHIALDRLRGLNVPTHIKNRRFPTQYVISLSFIEGKLLAELPYKPSRRFWAECKSLLSKIHQRGVAHGDISPSNIIERDDRPYFIDFADANLAPGASEIARDKASLASVKRTINRSAKADLPAPVRRSNRRAPKPEAASRTADEKT